jgi:hypothetical protein
MEKIEKNQPMNFSIKVGKRWENDKNEPPNLAKWAQINDFGPWWGIMISNSLEVMNILFRVEWLQFGLNRGDVGYNRMMCAKSNNIYISL